MTSMDCRSGFATPRTRCRTSSACVSRHVALYRFGMGDVQRYVTTGRVKATKEPQVVSQFELDSGWISASGGAAVFKLRHCRAAPSRTAVVRLCTIMLEVT